jgi:hypothetical protein
MERLSTLLSVQKREEEVPVLFFGLAKLDLRPEVDGLSAGVALSIAGQFDACAAARAVFGGDLHRDLEAASSLPLPSAL